MNRGKPRERQRKLIKLVSDEFEDHTEDPSMALMMQNRESSDALLKRLQFYHRHGYGDYNTTGTGK